MNKKSNLLFALGISLLLIAQSAHADFRKALDAYIARDGATMLAEVKDATDKKNDDGLMLFLHAMRIDASTTFKKNLYETFQEKTIVKNTLDSILTEFQRHELFDLLGLAAKNNSSIDTQYLYADVQRLFGLAIDNYNWAKTIDDYAKKGSYVANAFSDDLLAKAKAGDPFSQLRLGLKYINFVDYAGYGCAEDTKEPICQSKDETKGYALLRQALNTYEKRGHDEIGFYADSMCDLLQNTANGDKLKLKQAYLWCDVGINSGAQYSWSLLKKMNEYGSLKTEIKELPEWIVETRKDLVKEDLPVFTYYADDYMEYEIDVYADGRVTIGFGSTNNGFPGHYLGNISFADTKKDRLIKVSPKKVKAFLGDLKKAGFLNWSLNNDAFTFCDKPDATNCVRKSYQATFRKGDKTRRVYLSGLAGFADRKTIISEPLAKISILVEKYFPTQKLRCELGNSEGFKKACIERDNNWALIAKGSK